jgi:hypothetical protein
MTGVIGHMSEVELTWILPDMLFRHPKYNYKYIRFYVDNNNGSWRYFKIKVPLTEINRNKVHSEMRRT